MGNFSVHLPLELELHFLDDLPWVEPLALVLDALVVAGVASGLLFVFLRLKDWPRHIPLDALRYPTTHAVLRSWRRWYGHEGDQLRERGRAALRRVFGPHWWRVFLTERVVRGRLGITSDELRAWASVYLDAVAVLEPLSAARGARRR